MRVADLAAADLLEDDIIIPLSEISSSESEESSNISITSGDLLRFDDEDEDFLDDDEPVEEVLFRKYFFSVADFFAALALVGFAFTALLFGFEKISTDDFFVLIQPACDVGLGFLVELLDEEVDVDAAGEG